MSGLEREMTPPMKMAMVAKLEAAQSSARFRVEFLGGEKKTAEDRLELISGELSKMVQVMASLDDVLSLHKDTGTI
jgi:hypothetical protein